MKKIYTTILMAFIGCYSFAQPSNALNPTGNVGINTLSPNYNLDVNGTSNSSGQGWFSYGNNNMSGYSWTNSALTTNSIEIVNNNGTVSNLSPTLVFHRYGTGGPQFRLAADGTSVLYLESAGANSARNPNPYGGGPNSYFTRLHIDGALTTVGNVGIGTTAPNAKLQVTGTVLTGGGNANLDPAIGNMSFLAGSAQMVIGWNRTAGAGETDFMSNQGLGNTGGFAFYNYPNSGPEKQLMWIQGNGNVLIGTPLQPNAAYLLNVNGNVRANQIVVNTTGADFVFQPSYHLTPLSTLSKYISQNHHLPEIPSARHMQVNGLNVGDNQIKLLQKVEELTLYLVDKDKQLNEQQRQIAQQQKQLTDQQKLNADQNKKITDQEKINQSLQQQINELAKHIK